MSPAPYKQYRRIGIPKAIPAARADLARVLLLVFAFCAWSLTGPANIALALLVGLFLLDAPSHWQQLRREPAFWLMVGVWLATALLAVRAAWLFAPIADEQWLAVSAWGAPFLFFIVAWWLRRDPGLVWGMLAAAPLGLALGVLRKGDWSLLPQMLGGMRYHFGYAALGLAFIASVMLVGLLLMRRRIVRLRVRGRARPWLGWTLWVLGLAFLLFVLVVTQSRGAALSLAAAGALYAVLLILGRLHVAAPSRRQVRLALASAGILVMLATLLLWSTKGRQVEDWRALTRGGPELSYSESVAIRLNLVEVGLTAFLQRPLLGFGPGTSTTEYLVPRRVVRVSDYHLAHVPAISHLHSVPLEVLTRFGLAGILVAIALVAVLLRAYGGLWSDPRAAPDLRAFLTLGGAMALLYCLYDFRIVNIDLRFFFILFFGILYGLHLARTTDAVPAPGNKGNRRGPLA